MQAVSKGFYVGLAVAVCTVYGVMLVPTVWRDTEAAKPTLEIIAPYDGPVRFYVGPWVWESPNTWRAPEGTVGLVDLRSLADASTAQEPRGYGFFAVHGELGAPYVALGTDLDAKIDPALWPVCSVPPGSYTVEELLWNTLTVWADPETHNGPLLPNSRGNLELWLNVEPPAQARGMELSAMARSTTMEPAPSPAPLVTRAWQGIDDPSWPVVQETLHQAYRETPEDVRGKLLTDWQRVYRIEDVREFIPPDMQVIEPQPMETSYSESFNTANSDTLGPDLTWAEIDGDMDVSGNTAIVGTSGYASARAEHALSSPNHWAEIVISESTWSLVDTVARVCVRFSSSADTYYAVRHRHTALATYDYAIVKVVAGTETRLSASDTAYTPTLPATWRITVDGSTVSLSLAGFGLGSLVDSTIASGTRCGISGDNGDPLLGRVRIDSFACADIRSGVGVLVNGPTIHSLVNGGLIH